MQVHEEVEGEQQREVVSEVVEAKVEEEGEVIRGGGGVAAHKSGGVGGGWGKKSRGVVGDWGKKRRQP